jgi:NADH-quinone oxidoreductase subunit K
MGLAAAEATLVLAMVLVAVKRTGTADSDRLAELKG